MNNQMLGIIDAAVNQHSLQDLTAAGLRSVAVPFARMYRLIDFALSGMVHVGFGVSLYFPSLRIVP